MDKLFTTRDNAPQQVPRAGELAGVLSARYPGLQTAYPQDYAQGYKAAAFTLTHRDDGEGWFESLFALSRKIIGIDCLRLTIKERKGRARDAPGYESRHKISSQSSERFS